MKLSAKKKVLGLALGERSLLAAEVVASQQPKVEHVAEFVYPADLSLATPAALGKALAKFLKENGFASKSAVIGLPIKWLLVKTKSVPPITGPTLANMLRLEAESEFSSELKDLVFEYAESAGGEGKSVLLLATPRKNVDAAAEFCEAARLGLIAVTPSALALSRALGSSSEKEMLVLSLNQGGSEITAQQGAAASGMKHLRAAEPQPIFVSELRRTMTTMPPGIGGREMILWNGIGGSALNAESLSQQIGLPVRSGELRGLGVDAAASINGQSQKFPGAVALALVGLSDRPTADFLHSRLAPISIHRIPRWAYLAVAAAIAVIVWSVMSYNDLQSQQADLDVLQANLAKAKPMVAAAKTFIAKVSTAWQWHSESPRYLACWRDLTIAIPADGETYLTSLTLREEAPHQAGTTGAAANKTIQSRRLTATLDGRAPDQSGAVRLVDQLNHNPAFIGAKLENTSPVPRSREVTFQVTFTYDPDKAK